MEAINDKVQCELLPNSKLFNDFKDKEGLLIENSVDSRISIYMLVLHSYLSSKLLFYIITVYF